jgi:hypothetical protein
MRPRSNCIVVLSTLLCLGGIPATSYAARTTGGAPEAPPAGALRHAAPPSETILQGSKTRAIQRAPAAGETVYVWSDNMETRSSPSNEGGFSHYDQSVKPTAWHIDSLAGLSCQGAAWWCGIVDSTWTFDSNRAGYDNDWTQYLTLQVDLSDVPPGVPVTLHYRHKFNAEPDYDYGTVEIFDLDEDWLPYAQYTGKVPNNQSLCDSVTILVADSSRIKTPFLHFRFKFTSDVGYSSADGLYDGDGWIIDNITIKAGGVVRFFDDGHGVPNSWMASTFPGVGDFFWISSGVFTEDLCASNMSKLWTDWDPVVQSSVPRMDNLLNTRPIAINRASNAFVEFDVYRNLPLNACFYYHLNFRTKNAGDANWSLWQDPTFFVYYGGSKDWARQRISLPGAGNHDSLQVQLGLRDYAETYCDGVSSPGGVYAFFDNIAVGVIGTAPPSFVVRDIDLFNDTFHTTPFFRDDNFNAPVGDTTVVNVNASFGYKQGFMYYRTGPGAFSSTPLARVAPALPTRFQADVPAGSYPAGTTLEYYFSATDSLNNTAYYPLDAITAQRYLTASILPVKTATNPAGSCFDSLATILYVNHFSGRETSPRIVDALKALGHKLDTWEVNGPSSGVGNSLGGSDPTDIQYHWPVTDVISLLQYKTIIWHSGDLSSFTISKEDQAVIQSWVQQSGKDRNFWITGDDVAFDLATGADYNSFLMFTTGARYVRTAWENAPQDTLHPVVTGVAGGPAAGRFLHLNGDCPILNKFDMIASSPTAVAGGRAGTLLRYPNTQPAATRYATKYTSFGTDSARAVFMGFSFNAIEEGGERLQLAKAIVQTYFKEAPCYTPTGVEESPGGAAPPVRTQLFQNAPNPFNPMTAIRFTVAGQGPVRIDIFSVNGRRVRTLVDKSYEPGDYTVRWDGTDDQGHSLASGAYFYRFRAAGASDSKKLILLR